MAITQTMAEIRAQHGAPARTIKKLFSNVMVFPTPNPKCHMVVNTHNKKACLVEPEIARHVRDREIGRLVEAEPEIVSYFEDLGIVLNPDDNDTMDILESLKSNQRTVSSHNITFALTYACNMDCFYCIEAGIDRRDKVLTNFFASEENFAHVLEFLERRIVQKGSGIPINMHWYGGEPLLKPKAMRLITNTMMARFPEHDITSTITTNGTLVDETALQILRDSKTIVAQVTVDGTEKTHNEIRYLKNTRAPTYRTVLSNIEKLSEIMRVVVRYNWNMDHGLEPIEEYYQNMSDKFGGNDNIEFYVIPTAANSVSCGSFFKLAQNEEQAALLAQFIDTDFKCRETHGLQIKGMGYDVFNCSANIDGNIVVSFNGDLYSCVSSVGKQEARIGNIAIGLNGRHQVFRDNLPIDDECLACEFLLSCGGGCRYYAATENKDIHSKHCNKRRSEIIVRENYLKIFANEIAAF